MATVYRAHDTASGQDVALKVLHPTLWQDIDSRHRFGREARELADVAHPNVVKILSTSGESDPVPYLVMELIEGPSLDQLIREQGRLPFEIALVLMSEILGGLEALHRKGVMHRDLKPSNILITGEGRPCIADLGLARRLDETAITVTGTALGTLRYLPPEAFDNEKPTQAWDTWAMGNIFYEVVCGQPPFDQETTSGLIMQVIQVSYVRARDRVRDLDPAVEDLIQRALRHPATERHPSASTMQSDVLACCLEHGLTDPTGLLHRWFSARRSPTIAAEIRSRTIGRLVARAESHQSRGEDLDLLAIADRLATLDPENPRLDSWLAGRPVQAPDPLTSSQAVTSITQRPDGSTAPIPFLARAEEPAPQAPVVSTVPTRGSRAMLMSHAASVSFFALLLAGDITDPPIRMLSIPLLLALISLLWMRYRPTPLTWGLAAGAWIGTFLCLAASSGRLFNCLALYTLVSPGAIALCSVALILTSGYWALMLWPGRSPGTLAWNRTALTLGTIAGPLVLMLGGPIQATSRSVKLSREMEVLRPSPDSPAPRRGIQHASALARGGGVTFNQLPWSPADIHRFYRGRGVRDFSLFFGWDLRSPRGGASAIGSGNAIHELASALREESVDLLLAPNTLYCDSPGARIRPQEFWRGFHEVVAGWTSDLDPRYLALPGGEDQGWSRWVDLDSPEDLREWRDGCSAVIARLREENPRILLGVIELLDPVRRDPMADRDRLLRWAGMEGISWLGIMTVAAELDVPAMDLILAQVRRKGPDQDVILFTRTGALGVRRLPFEEAVDSAWIEYLGRFSRSRGIEAWYHRPNDSFLLYAPPWSKAPEAIPGSAPFHRFLSLFEGVPGGGP